MFHLSVILKWSRMAVICFSTFPEMLWQKIQDLRSVKFFQQPTEYCQTLVPMLCGGRFTKSLVRAWIRHWCTSSNSRKNFTYPVRPGRSMFCQIIKPPVTFHSDFRPNSRVGRFGSQSGRYTQKSAWHFQSPVQEFTEHLDNIR